MPKPIDHYVNKIGQYGVLNALREAVLRSSVSVYGSSRPVRTICSRFAKEKHCRQWVFILGCYNSGTTLLQKLLSAHPSLCTLPKEGVRLTGELKRPEDIGWTRMWNECLDYMYSDLNNNNESAKKIRRDWAPWWRGQGNVFLEKSITNILRANWLEKHFPHSCFVGIVRNGFAVSEGIVRKALPKGPIKKQFPHGYPVEMAAREWVAANRLLLEYVESLGRYAWIRYEDLIEYPEEILKTLFQFLGLDECSVHATPDGVKISNTEFELWNGNEITLKRMSSERIEKVRPIVAPLCQKFGYE